MLSRTAEVVVFANVPKALSYAVSQEACLGVGSRVRVPLKTTMRVGVVVCLQQGEVEGLKPIAEVLDEEPLIPPEVLELVFFCSRYYHAAIGACLSLALSPYLRRGGQLEITPASKVVKTGGAPQGLGRMQHKILEAIPEEGLGLEDLRKRVPGSAPSLRRLMERGLVDLKEETLRFDTRPAPCYSDQQQQAIDLIRQALEARTYRAMIVHGITGSGKTEVYLAASQQALAAGRSVLYLVPEIALTPQTIARVRERIPFEMALFHSGLGARERAREFMRVSCGKVRFVLGTRSAIFAPLRNLGLVVVDEEHDGSYKQSEGVPYNARDLGMLRAHSAQAVILLGSATPSVETFLKAATHQATLISMPSRVGQGQYPAIEIVDMRSRSAMIAPELLAGLEQTASRGEQSLLFVNRRGFSSAMVCPGCGLVLKCRHCDRSLTYHKARARGVCHYCGYTLELPEICPACGCLDMKPLGVGTERVMELVTEHFPGLRLLKMDSDAVDTPSKLYRALDAIARGEVDVVVGTQMIAKGHDFHLLTLVGVLNAEQLLYLPDFRATERTFQQVVQVAGRAGRHRQDTRVIIQTLIPDHPVIEAIRQGDYAALVRMEQETRLAAGFPPFVHLARCVFASPREEESARAAREACSRLELTGLTMLGPAPAPIAFLRGAYRWHVLLSAASRSVLHQALGILEQVRLPSAVTLRMDVDPYDML